MAVWGKGLLVAVLLVGLHVFREVNLLGRCRVSNLIRGHGGKGRSFGTLLVAWGCFVVDFRPVPSAL